jgi:hypothetical protein
MEGADHAYEALLGLFRAEFPGLADQIQEEAARGRTFKASELSRADRQAREARMSELKPGQRIGNDEQAVVPFSDEQRLDVALASLERWLSVAVSTRTTLAELAESHELEPMVRLSPPDEAQQGSLAVPLIITPDDQAAIAQVLAVTGQARSELR